MADAEFGTILGFPSALTSLAHKASSEFGLG